MISFPEWLRNHAVTPSTTAVHRPADKRGTPDTREDNSTSNSSAFAKWGEAAEPGLQPLLDVLLKNQSKLGLTATDTLVLMNLAAEWCSQRPLPPSATIAARMGVGVRTVQRALATLRQLGVLTKLGNFPTEIIRESRFV